jgi:hypothetical protein
MVTRVSGDRLPPRKVDLRDTLLHSREMRMMKSLINETNLLQRSFNEIHGAGVEQRDMRDVVFKFHGQGAFRAAYLVEMNVRGFGRAEMICKISHEAWDSHVTHQILGKIVDPRNELSPITAGLWQMPNGKVILTEQMIAGRTFDNFMGGLFSNVQKMEIATLLCRTSFFFWKDFHHIFINDPHRHQFVIVERRHGPGISIVDTGCVTTVGDISYEIPNDGDVILKNKKGETIPQLDWIKKTSPRELVADLIFNLEKPDEQLGGDFQDISGPYERAYNLPRLALFSGIIQAFGWKDGVAFLRDIQGLDGELDDLARKRKVY